MNITHLECGLCGLKHEARRLLNLCGECGKPLLVRYDLDRARQTLTKESLLGRRADLWRYREVLPVENDDNIVSLGEGWTPLLRAARLGARTGIRELYIKDESQNPTQSFKARGMAAYSELQEAEFAAEAEGYTATKHQREVGTGYFDEVAKVISGGECSTAALHGSTEAEQFH